MPDEIEVMSESPMQPDPEKLPEKMHTLNRVVGDVNVSQGGTADSLLEEIIKMDEDKFIPWEEVALPSLGYYYDGMIPGGIVRVKGMGIHADKILSTQRLAQTGQSIDYLFNNCVQLPNDFDQSELLTGDRIFLLYVLRGITHGNKYEFLMKCANCQASSTHVYDLNELAATITRPNSALGDEPFRVDLPYMSAALKRKVWVRVRLVRGKDTTTIANRVKFNKRVRSGLVTQQQRNQIAIDEAVTENLNLIIVGFGAEGSTGETSDKSKIKSLVEKMHSSDTAEIRQFLRNNSPGIDTTIEVECPECGHEYKAELPITESFFRPTGNGTAG